MSWHENPHVPMLVFEGNRPVIVIFVEKILCVRSVLFGQDRYRLFHKRQKSVLDGVGQFSHKVANTPATVALRASKSRSCRVTKQVDPSGK